MRRNGGGRAGRQRDHPGRGRAEPAGGTRTLRRRGAGDRGQGAPGAYARPGAPGDAAGRDHLRRSGRRCGQLRARADRRPDRRRGRGQGDRAVGRHPVPGDQSPGSACADRATAGPGAKWGAVPLSAAAAVRRALPMRGRGGGGPVPAAGHHDRRRGGRSVRQSGQVAGPGLARRSRAGTPGHGRRPGPGEAAPAAAGPAGVRLQLLRPENRSGAACGGVPGGAATAPGSGRSGFWVPSRRGGGAGRPGVPRARYDAGSAADGGGRRCRRQRHGACRAGRGRGTQRGGAAGAAHPPVHGQCRDGGLGRAGAAAPGLDGRAGRRTPSALAPSGVGPARRMTYA